MISEPIPFLANIALVAHADGKLSPSELGQMEAIRTELKFLKRDFNKAVKLVESGNHKLIPVGTFGDQVKNLELMLRVAYADNDLDEDESALVSEFCTLIGVYQDQLTKLAGEVLNSLQTQPKLCPKCGEKSDADAKFCGSCGNPLEGEEEAVRVEFELPAYGISIEFADSTSASFPKALELAKGADSYQTCEKSNKTWHLATFNSGSAIDALPLAQLLSGLKNKTAYLAGEKKDWDDLFGFAWCAQNRASAYRPIEYCFGKDENRLNPWGCRNSRMDWTEWANWFSYGSWKKGGLGKSKFVWEFDKERIGHELASNLYRFRFCPHLVPNLGAAILKHLPDRVDPFKDKNWSYNENYEEVPGAIQILVDRDYGYSDTIWADGVRPKGLRIFGEILKKALAEVGANHVSAHELLS